jgi:hypothetical protein
MSLKTETHSPRIEARVLKAARLVLRRRGGTLAADFEHGQWWVTDLETGAQWAVVDAEGGRSVDGFDFERVTQGDEE